MRFLALLLFFAGALSAAPRELTIFHLNDAHGYIFARTEKNEVVGGFAMLAGALAKARAEAKARGAAVLFLFGGDMFQGTTVVEATRGACMVELFNRLKLDASCLGNHEFDYGPKNLSERLAEARYPIVATNIQTRLSPIGRLMRDRVMLDVDGIKVGLVGATTVNTPASSFPEHIRDFQFADAAVALPPVVAKLKSEGARVLLALTHIGVTADKALAQACPSLDAIIGGHSHTVLAEPVIEGKIPIVQAGEYTRYLGELRLALNDDGTTTLTSARLIRLVAPETPSDPDVAKAVDAYLAPVAKAMAVLVGSLEVDIPQGGRGEDSPMASVMASALREAGNADVGFANRGGVRRALAKGPLTMGAIVEVVPFGNTLVTMDLTGAQIRSLMERSVGGEWVPGPNGPLPGKRTAGMVQPSGLTMTFDSSKPEGQRVLELRIGDKPVANDKLYRVACTNFVADGGDKLTELTEGANRKNSPLRDRDMLVTWFSKRTPLKSLPPAPLTNVANPPRTH